MKTQLFSKGSCGVMSEVIDEFLELAFTDIPNVPSGRKRTTGTFNC
jgi:hypothetical protein